MMIMNNESIRRLEKVMKEHLAYCSFNCLPMTDRRLDFSFKTGVFKKLFVGDEREKSGLRSKQLFYLSSIIEKETLGHINNVIKRSGATPMFIIVAIKNVQPPSTYDDAGIHSLVGLIGGMFFEIFTASCPVEAERIVLQHSSPTTIFVVKHYLPDSVKEVIEGLTGHNYNISKKQNFGGYLYEASVNVERMGSLLDEDYQRLKSILENGFPHSKIKIVKRSRRSYNTIYVIQSIKFQFSRLSDLNRLKLYDFTKNLVLNVNVSVDALLGGK